MFSQLARFRKSWWYSIILLFILRTKMIYCFKIFIMFVVLFPSPSSKNSKILKGIFDILSCSMRLYLLQKKVVTYNNSWPCSNSFVLIFVAVRALRGLSVSLFCTFCVLNVMTKSRDEPTSLSIASTISLLPPFFLPLAFCALKILES